MLSARPKKDCVDRITRRLNSYVVQGRSDIRTPGSPHHSVQNMESSNFGILNFRANRRAKTKLQLTGGNAREYGAANSRPNEANHQQRNRCICAKQNPAIGHQFLERSTEMIAKLRQDCALVAVTALARWTQNPDREHWNKGAGQQIRGHHRECYGQREWHKQRLRDTLHEE